MEDSSDSGLPASRGSSSLARTSDRDGRPEAGSHADRFGPNDAHFDGNYHLAAHLSAETWSQNTQTDSDSERDSLAYDVQQCCSLSPPGSLAGTYEETVDLSPVDTAHVSTYRVL